MWVWRRGERIKSGVCKMKIICIYIYICTLKKEVKASVFSVPLYRYAEHFLCSYVVFLSLVHLSEVLCVASQEIWWPSGFSLIFPTSQFFLPPCHRCVKHTTCDFSVFSPKVFSHRIENPISTQQSKVLEISLERPSFCDMLSNHHFLENPSCIYSSGKRFHCVSVLVPIESFEGKRTLEVRQWWR